MNTPPGDIYGFLEAHGIPYERLDHPPVYTVEEASRLVPPGPGTPTKNLFLRDEKGRRHFLLTVAHDKQVDLRRMAGVMGSSKLSLGSPKRLARHLGVQPGAVTILALINDPDRRVEVFIDGDLWKSAAVRCHPLVNTATLIVPREGLERFLAATGHSYRLIRIPTADG
ncbi:MAG: prolyl-tRNA synthetase associated domain-containing protein [Gemmatimonadetes bacterium]|nr:prolyl-tRNA synthetase associated domain-containing protein [Gemmatimonadota bacterium]